MIGRTLLQPLLTKESTRPAFRKFRQLLLTAVIDAAALRLFMDEAFDPAKLGGALVRLRGWIDTRDGPRMTLTHPEQIEILAGP